MNEALWPSVLFDPEVKEYCYMQYGASPPCTNAALEFLVEKFPNHVISRRSQRCWPTRSPNLNPLDFFVWGYLDSKLAENNSATIEGAEIIVEEEVRNITPETLR